MQGCVKFLQNISQIVIFFIKGISEPNIRFQDEEEVIDWKKWRSWISKENSYDLEFTITNQI